MTGLDLKIAELADTQFGVISHAQFRTLGGGRGQIRGRTERGLLVPIGPRAYRIGGAPVTWRMRLFAGLLTFGDEALVSHHAAAALHRFDGFHEGPTEFTIPATRRASTSFATVHTTRRRSPLDRTTIEEAFACTAASRTIIDLAATLVSATMLANAIDSAVRDGLSSPAYLRRRLTALRGPGVHGVRRLDELLIDSGGHSFLERRFLRLMREAGLPRPLCQVIHRRRARTFARVDFEFAPLPLVVEVSGRRRHVSEVDRGRDAQRRNELQADGFVVIEFLTADVIDGPDAVVASVRGHIARVTAKTNA